MYGLKIAKRPVRAKALIINAFALTGRIVFGGFLPQGVALGYVLLPLLGVLLRLLTSSPLTTEFSELAKVQLFPLSCLWNSRLLR